MEPVFQDPGLAESLIIQNIDYETPEMMSGDLTRAYVQANFDENMNDLIRRKEVQSVIFEVPEEEDMVSPMTSMRNNSFIRNDISEERTSKRRMDQHYEGTPKSES
jgi:hypothetical protein